MPQAIEIYNFKTSVVDRIEIDRLSSVFNDWRLQYFKVGVFGAVDERKMIGALLLKSIFRYDDRKLCDKLKIDTSLRSYLGLGLYFDSVEFFNSFVAFRRLVYRDYYKNHRNIIAESLTNISTDGIISLKVGNQSISVDSHVVLIDIIYQHIYVLVYGALEETLNTFISCIDTKTRAKIENITCRSKDVIYSLNHTQLSIRLDSLGEAAYALWKNLRLGAEHKLKTYFDKYYEIKCGQISLREINTFHTSRVQTNHPKTASEWFSQNYSSSSPIVNEHHSNNSQGKSSSQHSVDQTSHGVTSNEYNLLLKELRGISGRITDLEKKIETIDATIRRQFTSLTPFEKQLSRLETLYKNIDGLDKRILLQEESLKSMVEKHLQITLYTQDLSKTSKEVYELMKLVLMDSIIKKTKN